MAGISDPPIAIIGAGPFGLSIAAHLRYCGLEFRIFGTPMHRWRAHMPAGMFLKFEGFASNLADPTGRYTLEQFCTEAALPYGSAPVSLDTFTRYALSFQQSLVPMVEDVLVTALDRRLDRFELRLATGEKIVARKVVVATGLSHAAFLHTVPQSNGMKFQRGHHNVGQVCH
jgi:cation diffusion facilitator CzcD-associated flavoprotein CzcO